jgi:hypothetical protein
MATVNASNHAIISSANNMTKGRAPLPDNFFNTTRFEYVIGAGISSAAERVDHQDSLILQQYPQLEKFGLVWPTSNMVGFAVGLNGLPVDKLSSVSGLQEVFEKTHRLLFCAAISTLATAPPNGTKPAWEGARHETLGAVVLVRPIAIIVEAALGLITLLTLSLWYISYKRQSKLLSNPASIADVMSMSSNDSSISICLKENSTLEYPSATQKRFQLVGNASSVELVPVSSTISSESIDIVQRENVAMVATTAKKVQLYIRPRELRIWTGICLIGIILGSIGTIVYLLVRTSKNDGRRPLQLSFLGITNNMQE